MSGPNYILRTTYQRLSARLTYLEEVRLPEISQEKHDAYEEGGVHENAGYETAAHDEAVVRAEITALRVRLAEPTFIDDLDINTDVISVGTLVEVENVEYGEVSVFLIVGFNEGDRVDESTELISFGSPLAQALLGKRANDTATLRLPTGESVLYRVNRIGAYFPRARDFNT